MLLVDCVDNKDDLSGLLDVIYEDLSYTKRNYKKL